MALTRVNMAYAFHHFIGSKLWTGWREDITRIYRDTDGIVTVSSRFVGLKATSLRNPPTLSRFRLVSRTRRLIFTPRGAWDVAGAVSDRIDVVVYSQIIHNIRQVNDASVAKTPWCGGRTTSTGMVLCVSTLTVSLPSTIAEIPRRPCEAMTIRSHDFRAAVSMMAR